MGTRKGTAAVTGATGFLGSHIVSLLLSEGYHVRCLIRATSNGSHLPLDEVELIECELEDSAAIRRALKGCSLVVHTAAIHNRKLVDRDGIFATNVGGTKALIEAADSLDSFVFISSIRSLMTYKTPYVNEDTAYDFSKWDTPYGASKFEAEKECFNYYKSHKMPLYVLNPAVIIGPEDMRPSHNGAMILSHLKKKVAFVTRAMYSIVDVRDVAAAIPVILQNGAVGQRYIVCAANLPYRDFLEMIDRAAKKRKHYITLPHPILALVGLGFELVERIYPDFDPPVVRSSAKVAKLMTEFSGEKLRSLGFTYRDIEQTIEDTVKWFTKHSSYY